MVELFYINADIETCIDIARGIYRKKHGIYPNRIGIRVEDAPSDIPVNILEPPTAPPPQHFFMWFEEEDNGEIGELD